MTTYITNRKARHDFELLETFEAGLVLSGREVKSIRTGRAKLTGAHVKIYHQQAVLIGANIAPYQVANTPASYDPERARVLLLHKKEIAKLERVMQSARLTLIPLSLYNKNGKIKLSFALARGKKKADKRETLKQRTVSREINRTLKGV